MKKQIIEDVRISCDPPKVPYYLRQLGQEEIAKYYEDWVKEFEEFIRDHRSQDPVSLNVERIYSYVCSHCGYEWEDNAEGPNCCHEAIQEYENNLKKD